MTDATFRTVDGIPHVGDRGYPWAIEKWDRLTDREWHEPFGPTGFSEGFRLHTENAWEVRVVWTTGCPNDTDGDGQCSMKNCPCSVLADLLPAGSRAIVNCEAIGLDESFESTPRDRSWPHGTPLNWSFPTLHLTTQDRFEAVLAEAVTRPSPPWL